MKEMIEFTHEHGKKISISIDDIHNFSEVEGVHERALGKCFIGTGPNTVPNHGNGVFVTDTYEEVRAKLLCLK